MSILLKTLLRSVLRGWEVHHTALFESLSERKDLRFCALHCEG